jgi:hypothetical protein
MQVWFFLQIKKKNGLNSRILGVLVSMPPGPTLISTPSIPQQTQPKNNVQQGKTNVFFFLIWCSFVVIFKGFGEIG